MEHHTISVKTIDHVTHDVLRIVTTKPADYNFEPGQATEMAIDKPGWEEARRPFTFTSLPGDEHLEFIIKTYPNRDGMTKELLKVRSGDQLFIHDVFGAIQYQGKGLFVAGGAGITPFIAIFRHLQSINQVKGNRLLFANKTQEDIILESWFQELLGPSFINILSEEEKKGYLHGHISQNLLHDNINDQQEPVYICGPPPMMDAVQGYLKDLHIAQSSVVLEI